MKRMISLRCHYVTVIILSITVLLGTGACAGPSTSNSTTSFTISDTYKAGFGYFLIDGNGRTLYWTTTDAVNESNNGGAALTTWPVFYVSNIVLPLVPKITSPLKLLPQLYASDFSSITRADGTKQTTFKGWPLYFNAQDKVSGDTFGQGIDNAWFIVNPLVSGPVPSALIIDSPFNGAIEPPGNIQVKVRAINFNPVDKIGKANVPGEGHLNYFLDADAPTAPGKPAILKEGAWSAVGATTYTFINVSAGTHTISVELVNNDQTPLVPPVVAKVTFVMGTVTITTPPAGEIEATEFMGSKLTPISQQNNNALTGTKYINKTTYRLTIDGLVEHPLSLSYDDLQAYPQISQLTDLNCVDGWSFTAKWTGPSLSAILADAGTRTGAKIAIFYTADDPEGYTSLELSYINDQNIIIALKDNDITLPAERGFPFQVVAMSKYGYKWAKWVTRIELSADTNFLGYWERNGYSNNGSINLPIGQ